MHICFVAIFVTNSIWLSISINISSLVFVCSRWQGTVSDSSQQSRAGWPREVSCSGVSSDGKWKCLCVSDPWSAAPCLLTRVLIVTAPTTLTSQETLVLNQGKMFWRDFPEKQGISNACVQKIKLLFDITTKFVQKKWSRHGLLQRQKWREERLQGRERIPQWSLFQVHLLD